MKEAADRISHWPKWKKVANGGMQLGYDDDYTNEPFLEAMVMNANVVKRDLFKVFLFAPLITFCIKKYYFKLHLWFSFALISMALSIAFRLHRTLFVLLLGILVFASVVCPYWLIRIQAYKFEINGLWDEAKLCFYIIE